MELRRFLNFVWRSIGPQGALLYTALLIIRRVESSEQSRKPYHLSINYLSQFALANGPNVTVDQLNSSCDPFYVLPEPHASLMSEFVAGSVLSRQVRNSTEQAQLLLSLWRQALAPNRVAGEYAQRLTSLCSSLLEQDPRLSVCQVMAVKRPSLTPPRKASAENCIQRTLTRPSPSSTDKSSATIVDSLCDQGDAEELVEYIRRFEKLAASKKKAESSGPTGSPPSSSPTTPGVAESSGVASAGQPSPTSQEQAVAYATKQQLSSIVLWSKAPVFYCSRASPHSRRWFARQHLPLRVYAADLNKISRSLLWRRRRRRKKRQSGGGDAKQEKEFMTIGVVNLMYPLDGFVINQCKTGDRCSRITTQCEYQRPANSVPFTLGNYICKCRPGFYLRGKRKGYNGSEIEGSIARTPASNFRGTATSSGDSRQSVEDDVGPHCLPCTDRCDRCNDHGRCRVKLNFRMMRDFPLGVQSFCITVCLVVMGIVFKIRRKRVIKTSGWALIEIFIFGAVLLYSTVVVMYFEPTRLSCLLLPWLREVGFSITYGTLIVKVYRVLSGFQSRKAHRVCVRDKDVLRYILGIFVAVVAYMGACTAVNLDHLSSNPRSRMVEEGSTTEGLKFDVCRSGIWSAVAEASELLFLCWGLYYCHCVRSAPSEYSELRFITVSLIMETVVSLILHIAHHFIWYTLHPDYVYILYFLRCHLTVTITVILIIGPKLWYLHRPPPTQFGRTRALSHAESHLVQPIKLNLTSNGDIDLGEINIADMDPEDIRRELKRLYTQMEIYKTKEMRKDNPHVSKRRGGRKQTHRRFSLQPFHHKHRSHHASASVHEEEVSKVSDGSNNSGDEGASSERKTTS